jgi:nitrogen fixation NifU-like protein
MMGHGLIGPAIPMVQRRQCLASYNCWVFAPQLIDHFQNPRNAGQVSNPDASIQLENPVCGDILRLTLRMDGNHIAEIRFLAKGCVSAMACASAITELAQGKTLAEARRLTREELVQAIGSLPEASGHAAQLAMDALRAALDGIQSPATD